MWLLHSILIPTSKVIGKNTDGKKTTTRFAIADSQNSFIMIEEISEKFTESIQIKIKKQTTVQPLVLVVGKDLFHPKEF